jgi:glycosyltransferase involved in cell wall biosynthesis
LKVAFLAPEFMPTWGGVGVYSVNLIKELSKDSSLELHVITPQREDYDKIRIEKIFNNKITVHQVSKANDTFFYNLRFQLAVLKKFKKLHKACNFDLLHSANLVHMPDIFLKFTSQSIPTLVTAHTTIKGQVTGFLKSNKNFFRMAPSEKGSIIAYPIIALLEKFYLKKTKHIITVSEKFAKQFNSLGHKTGVTHNGIDMDIFNCNKKFPIQEVYPQLKKIQKPIILYAGRLITQKGMGVFVRAMEELQEKAHFIIAGRGDTTLLERLLKHHKIKKQNYTFLGFVDNDKLPALYKLSQIFVLPSFYENFPICLLEAMAMKCCCIATDVGAVTEIIDDGVDGIVIEPGSSKSLSNKVNYLLDNQKARKRLTKNAYRKVKANFTSKIMAQKTKMIYQKIVR